MRPRFFTEARELRAWFESHAATGSELWIGYFKKGSGRRSLSYHEVLDEALCFGWIDGQVRRVDDLSYANRFTPRRPRSAWSVANLRRVRALIREGRMRPAGLAAYRARRRGRRVPRPSNGSSGPRASLDGLDRARLKAAPRASAYFDSQPPGYRRLMVRWITSARRPETRSKRLMAVIDASRAGRRVDPIRPYARAPARRKPSGKRSAPGRETS